MAVNAIDLAEELQARTDFSSRNASGIAHAITRALEGTTAQLLTRDQADARFAELPSELKTDIASVRTEIASVRTEIAELRADNAAMRAESRTEIAELRAEMHQLIRTQTLWMTTTMIGTAGVLLAAIKLLP